MANSYVARMVRQVLAVETRPVEAARMAVRLVKSFIVPAEGWSVRYVDWRIEPKGWIALVVNSGVDVVVGMIEERFSKLNSVCYGSCRGGEKQKKERRDSRARADLCL